jgi:hypothetical protein
MMLTWKVWTDNDSPAFEGSEEQARTHIVGQCLNAVLESPEGESYEYKDGIWVSLDGAWGN